MDRTLHGAASGPAQSRFLRGRDEVEVLQDLLTLSLATTLCAAVLFQPALMGPPRVCKDKDE